MQRYLFFIDRVSEWSGKAFAWLIIVLTVAVSYDVLARYLFRAPTDWAYDAAYILYGSLFMMAGAYTLSRNGHVRGDVLYGFFPAARTGRPRSCALFPVFHSRHRGAGLRRRGFRPHLLGP